MPGPPLATVRMGVGVRSGDARPGPDRVGDRRGGPADEARQVPAGDQEGVVGGVAVQRGDEPDGGVVESGLTQHADVLVGGDLVEGDGPAEDIGEGFGEVPHGPGRVAAEFVGGIVVPGADERDGGGLGVVVARGARNAAIPCDGDDDAGLAGLLEGGLVVVVVPAVAQEGVARSPGSSPACTPDEAAATA